MVILPQVLVSSCLVSSVFVALALTVSLSTSSPGHIELENRQARAQTPSRQIRCDRSECPSREAQQVELAVCITGLLTSSHRRRSSPIANSGATAMLRKWLDALGTTFVRRDVFLNLDFAEWTSRARFGESVDTCEEQGPENVSASVLSNLLHVLNPVSFRRATKACHCAAQLDSNCGCSYTYARWFQQVEKWGACLAQIAEHETVRGDRRYDFVAKLRTDYAVTTFFPLAEAAGSFAAAVNLTKRLPEHVFVHAWSNGACYGGLDNFWLAPRAASELIVRVLHAPCGWQRCLFRRYVNDSHALGCMANERVLVEWLLDHGSTVSPMPRSVGVLAKSFIGASHAWHAHGHQPHLVGCNEDDGRRITCNVAQQKRRHSSCEVDSISKLVSMHARGAALPSALAAAAVAHEVPVLEGSVLNGTSPGVAFDVKALNESFSGRLGGGGPPRRSRMAIERNAAAHVHDLSELLGFKLQHIRTRNASALLHSLDDKYPEAVRRDVDCALQHSQSGMAEDLLLLPTLLLHTAMKPGLFIELGAADGLTGSNTYMLEQCFGWGGLLVKRRPPTLPRCKVAAGGVLRWCTRRCAATSKRLPFHDMVVSCLPDSTACRRIFQTGLPRLRKGTRPTRLLT